MIGYHEALALILARVHRLPERPCPLEQALGRLLARPVSSPAELPPFDNAAMDGFALHAGDTRLPAGSEHAVMGAQAAGDALAQADSGAWEIMTGARMPAGLDTVVPVEQVEIVEHDGDGRPRRIRLGIDLEAGRHVRRGGEDVPLGAELMPAGELLQAQHLALLAALGIAEVPVVRRPKVAVICTGRELVDDPGQPLQSGQIRNSNGPFLAVRLAAAGAQVVYRQTVQDDPAAFVRALGEALHAGATVVLSTGAVSMGRHDFVPEALRGLGAQIHFHKLRIRPGKPLLFASLPDGSLFFGLPGNPVSSAVGLRFFVEPALRGMLGLPPERPLQLPLQQRFEQRVPLRCFLKGKLALAADGRLQAVLLDGQESFRIRPLLDTGAWVVLAEDAQVREPGSMVEVYALGHLQPLAIGSGA